MSALPGVRALAFDVFGTVVDWRSSIEAALRAAVQQKTASAEFGALPAALQARARALTDADLAALAQAWRASYGAFTRSFVAGTTPWKDVDAHHYDSLVALLAERQLAGLWDDGEVRALSLAWHRLAPWPDAAEGLRRLGRLGRGGATATLSNGNTALLRDLAAHGGLDFAHIFSAEDVRAYKPHPSVYLGAAAVLGVAPAEMALVAAHLHDLEAARGLGLRTVFVERPGEEPGTPGDARRQAARAWVDVWVGPDEDGLREVARRLGL